MSICPQCGAAVNENTVICPNCTALVNVSSENQAHSSSRTAELNARLAKALRRNELLSYAAAGLGLAIFAVIILISFL